MKILVIEDSMLYKKIIVKYLKEYLPEADYYVCSDGLEGYEACLKEQPDFITLDLLMPKMDGIEFLKLLKKEGIQTKVFVVSADVQQKMKDEVFELGALQFINKPFSSEKAKELAEIITGGLVC
ncbi:response regulator [Acetobacterium paludosum]|uniref:Stage 0 sporulation protein A homolog n=1 Tax=Acetobacterium paludosum TaxID=52693 RepID=A0A923KXV8_9FIRM|nr:response regulator [Acetobacterium paludosum]MBC3888846.1 response regulator [Acetobacterium paludosum]